MDTETEIEFVDLLIKTCDSLLDPRRPRHRPELAVPASRWKMEFLDERSTLNRKVERNGKPQPEQVPA